MDMLAEYGVALTLRVPVIKAGSQNFALGADWTPAAGDVKVIKDGTSANIGTLPAAVAHGNAALWTVSLTAAEMQAQEVIVLISDAATKAVEDQAFVIRTYGNASARHKINLNDSVRAGLTALPNATAAASGGLPVLDAGLRVKADLERWLNGTPYPLSGGFVNSVGAILDGTAQAGATGSITLAAGASATSQFYRGAAVLLRGGTGAWQAPRLITGYDGTTKVATVAPDWATAPDATSVYSVIPWSAVDVALWRLNAPNGLNAGRVDVLVGAMAAGVVDAAAFAQGAADKVWSTATRLLTAGTNIVLAKGTGVTGLNDLSAAQVKTEVVAGLNVDTYSEPGQGAPTATPTIRAMVHYLYKAWRNKNTQTATAWSLYNDAGAVVDQKAAVSDDSTTFTREEVAGGP